MYRFINLLYHRKIKEKFQQLLLYCDIKTKVEVYVAKLFIVSLVLSLIVALFVNIIFETSFIIIFLATFIVTHFSSYAWLTLNADAKARFVEDLLPDMLQLMSSNLRSGYTIDKALLLSARPEFGSFREEINTVGKEVATGKNFNEALASLGERVKSIKLKKTVQLVNAGQQSGGELASLLEESAGNLRQQRMIDDRVRSNVLIYVIFIFVAIAFGSPMLFGLSSFLIDIITDIFEQIELPEASSGVNLPITFSQVSIDPAFITKYVIVAMVVNSILGSFILGLISRGLEKEGIKFIPLLLFITIPLFFLIKFVVSKFLSGLFNI